MRALAALVLIVLPALAVAQPIVVSDDPGKVSVTVYRAPSGGQMNLRWLNGFALISETRRVSLPAGESELRFEGVAGGLIPQSAVVTGLGDDVIEKNRDAKLLSPGTLLDASLGRRVTLRRTLKATGEVRMQDAVIHAAANGVVVETEGGFEALRCTGLPETLLPSEVPEGLSAKPTLSTLVRAAQPYQGEVTLTYLSTGFDWRAHYVATVAPDGKTMSLFAWLTLANGDETSFADADTMAVAGRLNREYVRPLRPETSPVRLNCWPSQRTHETPGDTIEGQLGRMSQMIPPPPPPPPPAPAMEAQADSIVMTAAKATRENLGDLKLYRIPLPVTVASNSQKQVALIEQPRAKFESEYRWRSSFTAANDEPTPATQTLIFDNEEREGLGLPLPAGSFTLYTMRGGQPFLLGEGRMTDRAVGENVEVPIANAPGVRVSQVQIEDEGQIREVELTVTSDLPHSTRFEARFGGDYQLVSASPRLKRTEGEWRWTINLPANGVRTLRVRYRNP